MAMLWMEGFDTYNSPSELYRRYSSYGGDVMSNGRFGGRSVQWFAGSGNLRIDLPPRTDIWTSCARYWSEGFASGEIGFLSYGGAQGREGYIAIENGNKFKVYCGTTLIGSASYMMSPQVWYWYDVRITLHGTAGAIEIWVNDRQIMNLTNVDTVNSTETVMTYLNWYNTQGNRSLIDDLFVTDMLGSSNVGRIGDTRVRTLSPNSDAGPNQGVPNSGSAHYAPVDEVPYNPGDYITMDNTVGYREEFGIPTITASIDTIKGVQVHNLVQKTDANAVTGASYLHSGSTYTYGSNVSISSTTYDITSTIMENDPATGLPWSKATLAAAKIGYEVR